MRVANRTYNPERLLIVANVLSFSRGLLALLLIIFYALGAGSIVLVGIAIVMWATDLADGAVARGGVRRGAKARLDGQMIDPLMDDVALFSGFIILLDAQIVPLWFALVLATSRILFVLVRMIGLASQKPFARSIKITKISGACLGVGQCLLLLNVDGIKPILSSHTVTAIIVIMTSVLAVSSYYFLLRSNGSILAKTLR